MATPALKPAPPTSSSSSSATPPNVTPKLQIAPNSAPGTPTSPVTTPTFNQIAPSNATNPSTAIKKTSPISTTRSSPSPPKTTPTSTPGTPKAPPSTPIKGVTPLSTPTLSIKAFKSMSLFQNLSNNLSQEAGANSTQAISASAPSTPMSPSTKFPPYSTKFQIPTQSSSNPSTPTNPSSTPTASAPISNLSLKEQRKAHRRIEKQLQKDKRAFETTLRLHVVGLDGAGKSTLIRRMASCRVAAGADGGGGLVHDGVAGVVRSLVCVTGEWSDDMQELVQTTEKEFLLDSSSPEDSPASAPRRPEERDVVLDDVTFRLSEIQTRSKKERVAEKRRALYRSSAALRS